MAFYYVGSKKVIADDIISKFPRKVNNFYEYFVGSGAFLIALLKKINDGKIAVYGRILAFDINPVIISVHRLLKTDSTRIIAGLNLILDKMKSTPDKAALVKKLQDGFDTSSPITKACLFIFFQHNVFPGGMSVLQSDGTSLRKDLTMMTSSMDTRRHLSLYKLSMISALYQKYDVTFECNSFPISTLHHIYKTDDVVYLDPPYVGSENGRFYGQDDPCFNQIVQFMKKDVRVFMSNNGCDEVLKCCLENGFHCREIKKKLKYQNKPRTEVIVCNKHII